MRYAHMLLIWAALSLATRGTAREFRELALHHAVRAETVPIIDGSLDEACWKLAPPFSRYTHDAGKNPQETHIRIVWDDRGITFGVINMEAHPERIRASVRTRDGGQVWADDSNEFYVDPTATGYALYKFDVNSIGTIADFWQPDPGFTDHSWSATSARAASSTGTDAWTLEFFVPWSDLGVRAAPGDLWMFFHRRLAWTDADGKLTVTSSTGGNFMERKFGYISFTTAELPTPEALGERLGSAAAPWVVPMKNRWLWANGDGTPRLAEPPAVVAHYRELAEEAVSAAVELAATGTGERNAAALAELDRRLTVADDLMPVDAAASYQALIREGEELRDEIALEHFLTNAQ